MWNILVFLAYTFYFMKTDHEKNHMDFFTFNDGSYEELKIIFNENKDRCEG